MSDYFANAANLSAASDELRQIVRINEEIKHIVALAFKINLMAMNAIFLAKRAGQTALGFGVLSNELRRFASDLQSQMVSLKETTSNSVSAVTSMLSSAKVNTLLLRTQKACNASGRRIVDTVIQQRGLGMLSQKSFDMRALNRKLSQMILDTSQIVELGSVLARSAKIEAAYGGSFSPSLMQVSSDFELTIADIHRSLEKLSLNHGRDCL